MLISATRGGCPHLHPPRPVEMEDPFTRMSQNFFSFLSQIKQRGYVIATTQALSFSFFPPFSTTLVCESSTVLLEFPNHPQEFPNLPTPMKRPLFVLTFLKCGVNIQRGPLSSPLYYYRARRFKFSRGKNVGSASLHSTVGQYLHMLKLQFSK